jgi:cysteine desulfurase / selenocysteine lyase
MNVRKDFPILTRKVHGKPLVYLDNAATSQKPKAVIDILVKYYSEHNANVHRGMHLLAQEATHAYEQAHTKVEKFINASEGEVAFVRSTTDAINMVAYSLGSTLKKGDEIVLSLMEHHSNLVPWQQVAKRTGAILMWIPVDPKTGVLGDYDKVITKKTKIVAITHMSNSLGTINPVKKIIASAHKVGALVVVDGAQSVPHMPIDVKDLDCDFLAFSGHKMCAPTGIGVLYGKKALLEKMEPASFGGGMIHGVELTSSTWNDIPWKFEAGTPPIAEGIALGVAVDYLQEIGMENIHKHEQKLVQHALKRLATIKEVDVYGPKERGGIISFNPKNVHSHDVVELLDREGIAIRGGHHCTEPLMRLMGIAGTSRASFYFYNTLEEVDAFVDALQNTIRRFS